MKIIFQTRLLVKSSHLSVNYKVCAMKKIDYEGMISILAIFAIIAINVVSVVHICVVTIKFRDQPGSRC